MTAASAFHVSHKACHAPLVIALHCSGGNGRQWRNLAERLDDSYRFIAPDLIGAPGGGTWTIAGAFHLADEAAGVLEMIDHRDGVHLVGHSYGGGLALHTAAMRQDRLAGLSLYEPLPFAGSASWTLRATRCSANAGGRSAIHARYTTA
ncbi:alpha/beta fold hydrolase [Mesorhizobium sp. M0185]|uniref:alpha/beta fold hydrolase n=1 Tax=Mesorhizobium sp. M0185 TaxID=2956907 RepID=UPI003339DE98